MKTTGWKRNRGRSSYSEIAFRTLVSDQPYSIKDLYADLSEAGIHVNHADYYRIDGSDAISSCELTCILEDREFVISFEQDEEGRARIMIDADLLTFRNVTDLMFPSLEEWG
jgi:hypothetical protein